MEHEYPWASGSPEALKSRVGKMDKTKPCHGHLQSQMKTVAVRRRGPPADQMKSGKIVEAST